MTKTSAINVLNQDALPEMTRKRLYVVNVREMKNLKGKTSYDGISVAEDFTLFERSMIQEWTKKVKAKNEIEPSDFKYVWKVRGSPSEGHYMKCIEKGGRSLPTCLLYTSPSPRDQRGSRMPSSA